MKRFGILVLLMATFLVSCKKDKSIEAGTAAQIDGQEWTASDVDAQENNGVLVIEAKNADGETVVIRTNGTGEGTYDLSDNGNFCTFKRNGHFFAVHPGSDKPCGKVVIKDYDEANHTCSGYFDFNAYDENHQVVSCQGGHFGDIDVTASSTHHPHNGIFCSEVDDAYCASENITCHASNDHIKIKGQCGGKSVSFKCPAHAGEGEYNIGPWGGGSVSCEFGGGGSWLFGSFNANCGTFVITKHDEEHHIIEGSFHMSLITFNPLGNGSGVEFQHGTFTTQY